MNHSSTFASDDRVRSGHRYRPDDEPFDPMGSHADPSFDQHHAGYEAAPQADYHFHPASGGYDYAADAPVDPSYAQPAYQNESYAAPAAYDNAWDTNNTWAQQDWAQQGTWSDGGAWNAGDAWAENSGDAWAEEGSWTPDEKSWVSDTGCWAPEESWATDTTEPEAVDPEPSAPALPTVIPARRATNKRGGAHRVPAPPAALKGRAAVAAVAAGAVVAAGQAAFASPEQPSQAVDYEAAGQIHEIAAQSMNVADPTASPESPQVLNVSAPANLDQFNDMLQKGQKYAEDLATQEAAKLRPLFHKFFAAGTFTSGFGARWGVQHLGIDIAGPIGTPIYAVADGTVIEAGPASGFGMWVRLLHDDGTVTIYGHIDTATVSQGQRVLAGDQIATIGNRGFSTGPHCHFEVWLNGVDKVDPLPWLATRGISLGPQRD
ncbi:peptidoglycan DD-metalloendopeptidase family protein [Nocardia abscessus]|uniref:peptidoglycan DD-metalloendopeptidase family protein n=1 Tax=Nocardia abscessus TaxID=120957 RepID=UPI00245539C8|nr:peptidoglycan DD-metalloendopeptidase family protein [Nocardia abscessus]